ncbi:YcbK family protein [Aeromonas salmonicida]|uniref:YcbK family protein n=1 Tax=Aeromonas salmonicida TaxID=645 RepID=UPI003D3210F4
MFGSKSFTAKELRCKCKLCNQNKPHQVTPDALGRLQQLRDRVNRPLAITSAYRCPMHPEEAKKASPGQHAKGTAFDIAVADGSQRMQIVKAAIELGFNGIGIAKTFVHVDCRSGIPVIWTY